MERFLISRRFCLLIVFVSLTLRSLVVGEQPQETDEQFNKRIEFLIELLASPNDSPEIVKFKGFSNDEVKFGDAYSKEKQTQVYLAMKTLLSEDERAIDVLLKHCDDKRYSYTVHNTSDRNVSVGRACEEIVRKKMVGFSDDIELICQPQYLYAYFPDIQEINPTNDRLTIADYWEQRRKLGLVGIQKEELRRLIKLFETVDGKTVLPNRPEAARLPIEEFERQRDRNLRILRSIRESVESTGKPYLTTNVNPTYGSMHGLPWSVRRYNK